MAERPRPLDWSSLEIPLRRFAEATDLVVSAYDAEGERTLGPIASSPLGTLLVESDLLETGGPGQRFERELAARATRTDDASGRFDDQLRVHALALRYASSAAGSVVFGWVFADFATSHGSERLGRAIGVSGRTLWGIARLASPCSDRRIATYGRLLGMLMDSGMSLREAVDDLERVARARETFLALVSHDLRTPLSSISMRLDLMLSSQLDEPSELRKSLAAMQRSVREESRLIDDLLHVAVTRTGRFELDPQPIDLWDVLRAACASIGPMAEARGVDLRLEDGSVPSGTSRATMQMQGDAARLEQVLWNVLSNAVKFTPRDGQVQISATSDADRHAILIRDTGPGIPDEMLPKVFDAFTRTSYENSRGLGLGLSIAQQIVQLHGGHIEVETVDEPRGTIFKIELPREHGAKP